LKISIIYMIDAYLYIINNRLKMRDENMEQRTTKQKPEIRCKTDETKKAAEKAKPEPDRIQNAESSQKPKLTAEDKRSWVLGSSQYLYPIYKKWSR